MRPEALGQELLSDAEAMRLALHYARSGMRGANPLVGAVLLSPDGQLLETGFHWGAGHPHAELDLLTKVYERGLDPAGCRLFVTLEPCNHRGRTGPCSQLIAQAGLAEVVYACPDESPRAAGGADYLRQQGITVRGGLLEEEARALNERWLLASGQGRPFVTAKIASTLDGYVAANDGSSQWITGPEARADGHRLRARAEAIMVGTGTALADNPQLTAREADGSLSTSQPLRVVVGRSPLPAESYLGRAVSEGQALHYTSRDLAAVLADLKGRGIDHLLVEGGPTLITALIQADLVDELYWYQAPKLLGQGRPALGSLGLETLAQHRPWQLDDSGLDLGVRRLGQDVCLHLVPARS